MLLRVVVRMLLLLVVVKMVRMLMLVMRGMLRVVAIRRDGRRERWVKVHRRLARLRERARQRRESGRVNQASTARDRTGAR